MVGLDAHHTEVERLALLPVLLPVDRLLVLEEGLDAQGLDAQHMQLEVEDSVRTVDTDYSPQLPPVVGEDSRHRRHHMSNH